MPEKIVFQPVRGTENAIKRMPIAEGYLYFAYDTGKIYIDKSGSRYLMSSVGAGGGGGSTGFIWADGDDSTIIRAEDDDASTLFLIHPTALDDMTMPQVDALILNSDGRFFRVLGSRDEYILGELIAVSGSGGGSISTQDTYISYDPNTVDSGFTYIYGQTSYANFTASSDVDSQVTLTFVVTQNGEQIESFSDKIPSGGTYHFDTARLPKGNNITITVRASSVSSSMGNNDSRTRRILDNISTVELGINKDTGFNSTAIYQGEVGLQFTPIYNGLYQTLHVTIDNQTILNLEDDDRNKDFKNFKPMGNTAQTVIIPEQAHGAHTISLQVSTVISGNTLYSTPITYNVAWREQGNNTPVIWFGDYEKTVINYNECVIPFMVYDPEKEINSAKTKVYIDHNGNSIPTSPMEVSYSAADWIKLDVTNLYVAGPEEGAKNTFSFTCGTTIEKINIYVTTEGARDLGLVNPNRLILNLNSVGRSNNETSSSRVKWEYVNGTSTYTTTFNNFNWYNNGWLNDNDGNGSYLSVANGASAIVNLDTFTLSGSEQNYTFEIRFRVRNIQEYSTLIRTIPYYYILEDNESHTLADIEENHYTMKRDDDGNTIMDKSSPKTVSATAGVIFKYLNNQGYGFCIGTQEAYFQTPEGIANVRYKEDEIINLSFVIAKAGSNSSKLMSIYLNGILSGALSLSSTDPFVMDNNKFEINSEFCDVDIFKLRIYRTELSMPDVIHNYIADIHDIALYDQNQLTDINDGTILLYSKLLEYNENYPDNPSMPYAVWEIIDNGNGFNDPNKGPHASDDDKLPIFKGNNRYCKITFKNPSLDRAFEKGTIDAAFYKTHCPSYVGIGVDINVQGTSSQAYPRRNFKTKFKSATGKKDADKVAHSDWGWYYTDGPYKADYQTWLTGKDADGHAVDEEGRAEALGRCAFKKWGMDNTSCSTNKFTWKIDYMESSGTYNTGFANLVGNSIYNYHPLSRYPGLSTDGQGYRTSVYGFPVMVFHKHSTNEDKALNEERQYLAYEYIGRYNLNLDKSANEFYGFELDDIHPFVDNETTMADVAECWELRDNQGTWTSFKFPGAQERTTGFGTLTADGTLEVSKHFEPRYNNESDQVDFCRGIESAADLGYTDTTQIKMADGSLRDLSTNSAKNAYLREKFAHLESLFLWLDSTDTTIVPATDTGTPLPEPQTFNNSIPYMVETVREDGVDVVYFVDVEGNKLVKVTDVTEEDERKFYVYMRDGENIMTQAIAPDNYTGTVRTKDDTLITYNTDCAGYRLKKFVKEFNQHLDLEYCLVYFILTELLLCYDSRGKNLMIASWGPQQVGGDYIWFPIFYDIDTQLGLNNIGAVLWDYDTDATIQGTFSTANSVLWANFFSGFRKEIEEKYRSLRKASRLTEKTIEGAYLCDPEVFSNSYAMRGVRPVIALGLDEWYKYIAPGKSSSSWYSGTDRRYGYYVQSYENGNAKTTDASYVYTCQGDRKLSRELFIRNRLNFLDSWWLAGAYDSTSSGYKTEIMIRANANDKSTSDLFLDESKVSEEVNGYSRVHYPRKFYDAVPEFKITPFLAQYVTVFYDEDPLTPTIKFDGINAITTHTTPSVANGYKAIHPYNEQLTYIPGGDYLSDLGDLSLKYPSHFKLSTGKRLTQLLIGSDAPGYKNGIIGKEAGTFDLNDSADGTNKKGLLQKIVLTGLTALAQGQDVSGSEKLREFRALNTNIPSVIFADGSPLDTVHLPKSVSTVNIVHAKNLNNILTGYPAVMVPDAQEEYKYNDLAAYKGLYIENLTDWDRNTQSSDIYNSSDDNETRQNKIKNAISQIATLNLNDVNLGYDSYVLLENAIDIREKFRSNSFLAINYENVNWTPYSIIEADVEYDGITQFYELTDHNNFIPYTDHSAEKWSSLKLNSRLYIKDDSIEMQNKEQLIQNLDILQLFIRDFNEATDVASNHYRSTRGSEGITRPNITGNIYVCNDENHKINETDLTDVYSQYFPQLFITAKYIKESNVTKYVYIQPNSGIMETIESLRSDNEHPLPPSNLYTVPTKSGYDFIGWSTDAEGQHMFLNYEMNFNTGIGSYTNLENLNTYTFEEGKTILTLYAQFTVHKNVVTVYIGDTKVCAAIVDNGSEYEDPTYVYDYVDGLIDMTTRHMYFPYKDDSNLAFNETYKFIGYSGDANCSWHYDSNMVPVIDVLPPETIKNDTAIYSIFDVVDVHDNVLNNNYYYEVTNVTIGGTTYKCLQLQHQNELTGKITLPATVGGNVIKCFNNVGIVSDNTGPSVSSTITHIFWETGSQLAFVGSNACSWWENLQYFELPNYNTYIGQNAFNRTRSMFKNIDDTEVQSWCGKITTLDNGALMFMGSNYQQGAEYNSTQYLYGKTLTFSNIQIIGNSALQSIVCNGFIFGSTRNSTMTYTDWGREILNNTCKVGGGKIRYRTPLDLVRYYDHSGENAETIKNDLLYNYFYPSEQIETITSFDVTQPPWE